MMLTREDRGVIGTLLMFCGVLTGIFFLGLTLIAAVCWSMAQVVEWVVL